MTITTTGDAPDVANTSPTPSEYIASVVSEGALFAEAAEGGGLDVQIAACPGWEMRDLVRHVGEIHLWAAANVAFPAPRWLNVRELTDLARFWPDLASAWPDDGELVAWYRACLVRLVDVLESAPPDVEPFTFLPARTPLTMWARRQASEIAVHRFDAEHARGVESHFAPAFAGDMLDELLSGFARYYEVVGVDQERVLRVVATDVDEEWWLTLGPKGVRTSRRSTRADLTVAGTAAELYLDLWNRPSSDSPIDLVGDAGLLDVWRDNCRVVWIG